MTETLPRGAAPGLAEARRMLTTGPVAVLTGAGVSTDSGIPDYRGPRPDGSGPTPRTPMTFQEFASGTPAQQRYWARAHVGWTRMSGAAPNLSHHALHIAELTGRLSGLITQNVDGLHEATGHHRLLALHGRISEVVCLSCREISDRAALHARLGGLNPGYAERGAGAAMAPDGDALVDDTAGFRLAGCEGCGGMLKPHVVFFGENVPKDRVERAYEIVDGAAALLVAGSSLQVMSGLRFVRRAARDGKAVVIVNRGATRGDDLATVKVDAGCAETIPALLA